MILQNVIKSISRYQLLKDSSWYLVSSAFSAIIAFVMLPIISNYLLPEEYGVLGYLTMIRNFILPISLLSFHSYLFKNYTNSENKKDLLGQILYFLTIVNVFLFAVLYFSIYEIADQLGIGIKEYVLLVVIINFFDVFFYLLIAYLRINRNVMHYCLFTISKTVIEYIFTIFFVIFLGKGLDGRVLSIVISSVTIGITSYIILTQKSTFSNGFSKIKDCLAFSLPIIPSSYSMLIIILSDRIILERYVEWAELGIYTVAFSLTNLISLFTQSLYKSIEPYIFNNIENNNFKSRFLEVRKAYLFVISTVTLAFIVFINDFIQIFFDNKYIESSKFSGTLAIGTLLFGFYLIYTPILIALKKQKIIFSTSIIAAVLNVAINLILIPIIGVYGAIFSSIFSFFVISFVAIIYVRKFYIKINYLDELFILIALSVMATFVTFANDFMSNYTYFIVKIILFSIVFCLLTLGLGVFKSIKTLLKSQA